MPDIEKQIAERVEAFVADLTELLRRAALQQAADLLAEQASEGAPRGRGKRAGGVKRASKRNGRRSPAQIDRLTKRLLADIEAQPGRRIEEIAASLSASTKDLVIPTRRLLDGKKISRKGTRRATRYYPKRKRGSK